MVLWTDDPGDYASPGKGRIQIRLLDKVSNGGIILIHDGIQQTIDVLPQILQILKDKGYEFVTIDQMLDSQRTGRRSTRRLDKWKELRLDHRHAATLR